MHARATACAAFLAGVCLAVVASSHLAIARANSVSRSDSLIQRIDELRAAGDYAAALDQAHDLLVAAQDDSIDAPWVVADARRTLATLELVLQLPDAARSELAEADRLSEQYTDCRQAGEYGRAAELARRQLEIRRRLLGRRHPDVAHSLHELALNLKLLGDHAGAEPICREALELRRELLGPEHPETVTTLNNLGVLLIRRGNLDEGEPMVREVLAVRRRTLGEDHELVSPSLINLAGLYWRRGDYARAEPLVREALAVQRRRLGADHIDTAIPMNNLAVLLKLQGDYAAAEPLYRQALALRRKACGKEHPDVATSLNALAECLRAKGDLKAAEPLFREALAMRRRLLGDDHPDIAVNLSNLGKLLHERGDLDGAEPYLRQALAMTRHVLGDAHPDAAQGLYNLGRLLLDKGALIEAQDLLQAALRSQRQLGGDRHPNVASTLLELGRCIRLQGDLTTAEDMLTEAALVFETARLRAGTGLARATFQASPYAQLAATRLLIGNESEAWTACERALGRALADLLLVSGQRPLAADEAAAEDSLKGLLGELERRLQAQQAAARSDTTGATAAACETTRTRLLEVEAVWCAFRQDLTAKYPLAEGQGFPLARVQQSLTDDAALIGWLLVDLDRESSACWGYVIRATGQVHWVRLDQTSSAQGDRSAHAAAARARTFREILTCAGSWPFRVASVGRPNLIAGELWAFWMAPLLPHLEGTRTLVVIPSGALLGIPLETLVDENGICLGNRFAVSYAPSSTIYTWLRERPARPAAHDARCALLVGDPPFNPQHQTAMERETEAAGLASDFGREPADNPLQATLLRCALAGNETALTQLARLPRTREEVQRVAEVVANATTLLGTEASEQALIGMAHEGTLQEFDTIHLATHALVDAERPDHSALILSRVDLPDPLVATMEGRRIFDGLLTAEEIAREFTLHADLVTLSGCQTALGREAAGEGYVGLAQAFLQAGARSLLVSLWKVDDEATALLMGRFYENLAGCGAPEAGRPRRSPLSKVEALREAKRWLRAYQTEDGRTPFRHPAYWSGFVLVGEHGH